MLPIELAIVKGIPVPPGYTTSSEAPLEVINLLNAAGFSVDEKGWVRRTPQHNVATSAPGLYGGKQPTSYNEDNIKETFTLISTGATPNSRDWLIAKLGRMAENARAFHAGDYQLDPVYLKAWLPGALRPQYSSIFNINIAPGSDTFEEGKAITLTITIEREAGWTIIPPGEVPKIQTLELAGASWSYTDLEMGSSSSGNLFSASLQNGTVLNADGTIFQTGHIDIAAKDIPGDMPALVQFTLSNDSASIVGYYVATKSEPLIYPTLSARGHSNSFVANDATLANDTTLVADATVPKGNRARCTFATVTTDAARLSWSNVTMPVMTGRFMAFVRAYQSGGALNNIFMHLTVQNGTVSFLPPTPIVLPEIAPTVGGGFVMHPMGIIELPVAATPITTTLQGLGIASQVVNIQLYARRPVAAGELRVSDLLLLPVDENYNFITANEQFLVVDCAYDSTRYLSHGRLVDLAGMYVQDMGSSNGRQFYSQGNIQGGVIKLRPGVKNRIYFIWESSSGPIGVQTVPLRVRGNVVSRWSGAVDV